MTSIRAAIIVALAVSLAAGGCPAPRQRDKDQQTGMGPAERSLALPRGAHAHLGVEFTLV